MPGPAKSKWRSKLTASRPAGWSLGLGAAALPLALSLGAVHAPLYQALGVLAAELRQDEMAAQRRRGAGPGEAGHGRATNVVDFSLAPAPRPKPKVRRPPAPKPTVATPAQDRRTPSPVKTPTSAHAPAVPLTGDADMSSFRLALPPSVPAAIDTQRMAQAAGMAAHARPSGSRDGGSARASGRGGLGRGNAGGGGGGGSAAANLPPARRAPRRRDARWAAPLTAETLTLSAAALRERGVRDLGEALNLIPEVNLRQGGRGELLLDVRGARGRGMLVRIDGVPIDEPYFGRFDLSTIPVSDIRAIRVRKIPASPLDGPGGAAGVVDVWTLSALGPRLVRAQMQGSHPWGSQASVTGRIPLHPDHGLRLSAGGRQGARDYAVFLPDGTRAALNESRGRIFGGVRSEHRFGHSWLGSDTWVQQRRYTVPPEIQNGAQVTRVRRQTAMRSTLMGRSQVGAWQLRGQAHAQHLQQDWRRFTDATLGTALGDEAVQSQRFGGGMWGERPVAQRWALRLGSTVQHDRALAQSLNGQQVRGDATVVEPALGMQGQLHPHWQAALSAGAALPTGGITPWPEARLMLRYRPQADHHEATRQRWELRWTLARKGRLPSLRERFEPGFENPDLGPEIDNFGEMRLRLRPLPWLGLGGAGFVRHTEGFIRFNDARTARVNRGDAVVEGFDTRLDLFPVAGLKLGAAYNQLFAGRQARDLGIFDNTPQQRLDGWIEYGWRGKFGTWTRSRWLGSRSEGGEPVPAFWGVDAALWYKPHPTWRTSLRVDNVLDREQYLRPSVLAPGRSVVLSVDGQWP